MSPALDTGGRIGVAALVGLVAPAGEARAGHDMASMSETHHADSEVSIGVSVEAAEFETMFYVGSYQGVTPSLGWMRGRFGATAALGLYHLTQNGLSRYGAGDAALAAHATVLAGEAWQAGVALHVMLPTGSERENFGMGHAMATPSAWASWRAAPVTLSATAGYGRALVSIDETHDHGARPLVDPMNLQELTWSAAADVEVGHGVQLGGRTRGAAPIGNGQTRVIGGGRVAWASDHVTTGLEVQLGLVGDPFTIRGVVDTALRF